VSQDSPGLFYADEVPAISKKRMAKIKYDLKGINPTDLVAKCSKVVTMSETNAVFTSIAPKIVSLGNASDALDAGVTDLALKEQAVTNQRVVVNNLQVTAENAYRQAGSAAEGVTMDEAQLTGGGWDVRGAPVPVGPLSAPHNLSATFGDMPGSSDLNWDPVRGAASYIVECAISPTGPWTRTYEGTKSSCTASGLTSGQLYYFRVIAVGTAGHSAPSDIAEKRAS
jgi:hypothetical protein